MGDKTRLGFIPTAKIASTVGKKLWDDYRKAAEASVAARQASTAAKEQVRTALAKKLNLNANEIDFYSNDERLVIVKRETERKPRGSSLSEIAI
jgi:hypothetical protein